MDYLPCGCPPDAPDHFEPWVDLDLALFHCERSELNGDPEPYGHCLCGHPDYLSCPKWLTEGIMSMTISRGPRLCPKCGGGVAEEWDYGTTLQCRKGHKWQPESAEA